MRTALLALLLAVPAAAQTRLTLDEAVKRAVARNVNAQVAQQEILRAEALLEQARAPSMPTLNGFATGTQLDSARRSGGALVTGESTLAANVTLAVPLIAPERWVAWAHASDQVEVARLASQDVARGVAVATARAYLGVMAQHRLVQIDTQARDDARAHLNDAHARWEAGSGNRLDEVRAGQELATDEASLSAAQANLVRATEALGVLVGEPGPIEVTEEIQLPMPPDGAEAAKDAEELRPDVKAQRERVEAARRVVRDSYADYLPLLTAAVAPFYQHPATSSQPETGWQAQLLLTVPLFDGGLRYGLRR
ncbi:MAG TPA: TolC family protein, partial [Myxococcales bacterium]|nr:TolC family protein [Myxococcales bacterium]